MPDFHVKLEVLLDTYRLHFDRARRQAFMDSEYGYHESCQFNRGQQFVLDYVIKDLESLKDLLEVSGDG